MANARTKVQLWNQEIGNQEIDLACSYYKFVGIVQSIQSHEDLKNVNFALSKEYNFWWNTWENGSQPERLLKAIDYTKKYLFICNKLGVAPGIQLKTINCPALSQLGLFSDEGMAYFKFALTLKQVEPLNILAKQTFAKVKQPYSDFQEVVRKYAFDEIFKLDNRADFLYEQANIDLFNESHFSQMNHYKLEELDRVIQAYTFSLSNHWSNSKGDQKSLVHLMQAITYTKMRIKMREVSKNNPEGQFNTDLGIRLNDTCEALFLLDFNTKVGKAYYELACELKNSMPFIARAKKWLQEWKKHNNPDWLVCCLEDIARAHKIDEQTTQAEVTKSILAILNNDFKDDPSAKIIDRFTLEQRKRVFEPVFDLHPRAPYLFNEKNSDFFQKHHFEKMNDFNLRWFEQTYEHCFIELYRDWEKSLGDEQGLLSLQKSLVYIKKWIEIREVKNEPYANVFKLDASCNALFLLSLNSEVGEMYVDIASKLNQPWPFINRAENFFSMWQINTVAPDYINEGMLMQCVRDLELALIINQQVTRETEFARRLLNLLSQPEDLKSKLDSLRHKAQKRIYDLVFQLNPQADYLKHGPNFSNFSKRDMELMDEADSKFDLKNLINQSDLKQLSKTLESFYSFWWSKWENEHTDAALVKAIAYTKKYIVVCEKLKEDHKLRLKTDLSALHTLNLDSEAGRAYFALANTLNQPWPFINRVERSLKEWENDPVNTTLLMRAMDDLALALEIDKSETTKEAVVSNRLLILLDQPPAHLQSTLNCLSHQVRHSVSNVVHKLNPNFYANCVFLQGPFLELFFSQDMALMDAPDLDQLNDDELKHLKRVLKRFYKFWWKTWKEQHTEGALLQAIAYTNKYLTVCEKIRHFPSYVVILTIDHPALHELNLASEAGKAYVALARRLEQSWPFIFRGRKKFDSIHEWDLKNDLIPKGPKLRQAVITDALFDFTLAMEIDKERKGEKEKDLFSFKTTQDKEKVSYLFGKRGDVHLELGDFSAAISDYDQALELNPNNPGIDEIYNRRGEAYAVLGKFTEAISDLPPVTADAVPAPPVVHNSSLPVSPEENLDGSSLYKEGPFNDQSQISYSGYHHHVKGIHVPLSQRKPQSTKQKTLQTNDKMRPNESEQNEGRPNSLKVRITGIFHKKKPTELFPLIQIHQNQTDAVESASSSEKIMKTEDLNTNASRAIDTNTIPVSDASIEKYDPNASVHINIQYEVFKDHIQDDYRPQEFKKYPSQKNETTDEKSKRIIKEENKPMDDSYQVPVKVMNNYLATDWSLQQVNAPVVLDDDLKKNPSNTTMFDRKLALIEKLGGAQKLNRLEKDQYDELKAVKNLETAKQGNPEANRNTKSKTYRILEKNAETNPFIKGIWNTAYGLPFKSRKHDEQEKLLQKADELIQSLTTYQTGQYYLEVNLVKEHHDWTIKIQAAMDALYDTLKVLCEKYQVVTRDDEQRYEIFKKKYEEQRLKYSKQDNEDNMLTAEIDKCKSLHSAILDFHKGCKAKLDLEEHKAFAQHPSKVSEQTRQTFAWLQKRYTNLINETSDEKDKAFLRIQLARMEALSSILQANDNKLLAFCVAQDGTLQAVQWTSYMTRPIDNIVFKYEKSRKPYHEGAHHIKLYDKTLKKDMKEQADVFLTKDESMALYFRRENKPVPSYTNLPDYKKLMAKISHCSLLEKVVDTGALFPLEDWINMFQSYQTMIGAKNNVRNTKHQQNMARLFEKSKNDQPHNAFGPTQDGSSFFLGNN